MVVGVNLDRLRTELELRGWSWQRLADEAGLARSTVSRIAGGERPSVATLGRIAKVLTDNPPVPGLAELVAS